MSKSTITVNSETIRDIVKKATPLVSARYEKVRQAEILKEKEIRAAKLDRSPKWWQKVSKFPDDYLEETTIERDLLKRNWLEDSDITLVRAKGYFDHDSTHLKRVREVSLYSDSITFDLVDFNYLLKLQRNS